MRTRKFMLVLLPALALAAASAQAAVVVSFVEPDRYTDAGDRTWDREETLRRLDEYLHQLGEKYLAPNQTLRVEVLDVDLAGWPRFGGRAPNQVRTLTGRSDFPAMRLRYTLETPAGRSETREETIEDTSYLSRSLATRSSSGEPLYYEKRMLDDWFRTRFADGRR